MKYPALEKVLAEASEPFTTEVEVESFGNQPADLPPDSYLSHHSKVNVKWSFDEDYRSWGVKSMSPSIPDQTVEITFLESTEGDDIEHKIEWAITDAQFRFEVGEDVTSLQILPITLEIDFGKNESTLVFQVS